MDFSSLLEYDKTLLLAFNNNHNMFLDHVVLVFTSGYTWIPLYVSLFYLIVKNNEKWVASLGSSLFLVYRCFSHPNNNTYNITVFY